MAAAKRARKTPTPDAPTRLIDAAMSLAALQGWSETTLNEIAAEAKVPLAEIRGIFASKEALLAAYFKRLDEAMLQGVDGDYGDEPVRDRLFDIIMRRFDAMAPHRDGVRAVVRALLRDPALLACFAAGPIRRTLDWMLAGARVDPWGPLQPLQRKGLGLVYFNALRTWIRDDSADLDKTMAAVDKGLARAETVLKLLPIPTRFGTDGEETAETSA